MYHTDIRCQDDMNNQGAAHLAQLEDPNGIRTVGIASTDISDLHAILMET